MRMTSHEAFVETLRVQGVKYVFGIVGSAFADTGDGPETTARTMAIRKTGMESVMSARRMKNESTRPPRPS